MPQFNIIYSRDLKLFETNKLRVTKKEIIINVPSMRSAIRQARKNQPKGYFLYGIRTISLIMVLALLSCCATVKHWQDLKAPYQYTSPARFF